MIGGLGTHGTISQNEVGWRGEHPASPDGCAIDYEGGSDSVTVADNFIHDSYGAGIMVFGLSDPSRNISNASLLRNLFLRNGAQQTSDDHGEIAFMEHGSTGQFQVRTQTTSLMAHLCASPVLSRAALPGQYLLCRRHRPIVCLQRAPARHSRARLDCREQFNLAGESNSATSGGYTCDPEDCL